MRKRDLILWIRRRAQVAGTLWEFDREGGGHEIWRLGKATIAIPRHKNVGVNTARRIMRQVEKELHNEQL
jgi:hypothetical protein